ncbi:annexin A7 isoform X2 [Varanus komodoensis]|uniref:annexin A7 isoform X2 n=1 Tax=Varanus komodoensis TaxID=61221 RepID=UPI001CF7C0C8|nr:annexin A7 isoform X2 [Varanus komodoensis]
MSYPGYPPSGYPTFPGYPPTGQESSYPPVGQYPYPAAPGGFPPMGGGVYPAAPPAGGFPGSAGYSPGPGGYPPAPAGYPGAPQPSGMPAYPGGAGAGVPPSGPSFGYPQPPSQMYGGGPAQMPGGAAPAPAPPQVRHSPPPSPGCRAGSLACLLGSALLQPSDFQPGSLERARVLPRVSSSGTAGKPGSAPSITGPLCDAGAPLDSPGKPRGPWRASRSGRSGQSAPPVLLQRSEVRERRRPWADGKACGPAFRGQAGKEQPRAGSTGAFAPLAHDFFPIRASPPTDSLAGGAPCMEGGSGLSWGPQGAATRVSGSRQVSGAPPTPLFQNRLSALCGLHRKHGSAFTGVVERAVQRGAGGSRLGFAGDPCPPATEASPARPIAQGRRRQGSRCRERSRDRRLQRWSPGLDHARSPGSADRCQSAHVAPTRPAGPRGSPRSGQAPHSMARGHRGRPLPPQRG